MDSGIESTENSSGSSTDLSPFSLIESQNNSSPSNLGLDDSGLADDNNSYMGDVKLNTMACSNRVHKKIVNPYSPSLSCSKSTQNEDSNSDIGNLSDNVDVETKEVNDQIKIQQKMSSWNTSRKEWTYMDLDSCLDEQANVKMKRPFEIPRIDISSYESEPFPRTIKFPEDTCLKLNFLKYDSELSRVDEEIPPSLRRRFKSLANEYWKRSHDYRPAVESSAVLAYASPPLSDSHVCRNFKIIKKIVRQSRSSYPKDKKLRTAASLNDTYLVSKLLSEGVNPNTTDERKRTALHIAASKGYAEVVRDLLKFGANPNQKDSLGNTALHLAACTSHVEVVTLLLRAGTDLKQADNQGFSPLHLANSRLNILMRDPNPSSDFLRQQVCQIVEMMQEYLKSSGQTEEAELLTELTNKLSLSETSSSGDEDLKLLLSSLQSLTLAKGETA